MVSDENDFRDLRLHRLHIVEGESEQMFEEVVLTEVVITLVADLEEVPYFFQCFSVKNMVTRGMAKSKKELNLGLFIASAPVLVVLRISGGVGGRCSAINHVSESSVFKD